MPKTFEDIRREAFVMYERNQTAGNFAFVLRYALEEFRKATRVENGLPSTSPLSKGFDVCLFALAAKEKSFLEGK